MVSVSRNLLNEVVSQIHQRKLIVLLKMNLDITLALVLTLTLALTLILASTLALALTLILALTLTKTLALTITQALALTLTITPTLSNSNFNTKVSTRSCNNCNSVKPLTDFDKSKYTCRNCTSAKVNCLYCLFVERYDWIRAHVKRQHPNVELTKGFTRNLTPQRDIQTGESCSCKYYNFVSVLFNNRINIENVKDDINLLKSLDNLNLKNIEK